MASQKNCTICRNSISNDKYLSCCACQLYFDLQCVSISDQWFHNSMTSEHKKAWKCGSCVNIQSAAGIAKTPPGGGFVNVNFHRGASASATPPQLGVANLDMDVSYSDHQDGGSGASAAAVSGALRRDDIQLLVTEIRSFRAEVRRQLTDLTTRLDDIATRVDRCDARIDNVVERLDDVEGRLRVNQHTDGTLGETVEQLKADLNDRDQELLLNDLEFSCLPEDKNENVTHIVKLVAQKLGVSLTDYDIVSANRVGRVVGSDESSSARGAGAAGAPAGRARPRLIVVRFARRAVRDRLLQEARVRRGSTTEGMDLPGTPRRFYVNERLTRTNRHLFQNARQHKDLHKWRYAWTRDGKIFVKKGPGDGIPRHRIRAISDIERVFI